MVSIVVIGGGTGSYTVLRGLKRHTAELTAVVSMFDSGGSTGVLRDEFGILPPGDVRRCLLALSPEEAQTKVLRELFNVRFEQGGSLKGHSFGNLFLTALTRISKDEAQAIGKAAQLLRIRGQVLPVTLDNRTLCAELSNGMIIKGETNIDVPKHDPTLRIKRIFLDKPAKAYPAVTNAIRNADIIVLGPGDLYTSILPNLLVEGIAEAIAESEAAKIYVCNLMTKQGETTGFAASDFLEEVIHYLGGKPVDIIICNQKIGSQSLLARYARQFAFPVSIDKEAIESIGVILKTADLITEPDLIRHDPIKLADLIVSLAHGE